MPGDYDAFPIWRLSARQEIDDFREERNALRAENAKLREDLEDQEGYDQMLRDRLRQQTELHVKAEAENAKLRKLCVDLYKLADESYVPFVAENKWMDEFTDIERRMRELGIEADDA